MKHTIGSIIVVVAYVIAMFAPIWSQHEQTPEQIKLTYRMITLGGFILSFVGLAMLSDYARSIRYTINKALEIGTDRRTSDNPRHLRWVIDQMVRHLTDCPEIEDGKLGESKEYKELIQQTSSGPDGANTYPVDIGIAPQ